MSFVADVQDGTVVNVFVVPPDVDVETWAAAKGFVPCGNAAPLAGPGWLLREGFFVVPWWQITGAGGGPAGAEDGFLLGQRIFHAGHVWVSTVNFNVWEPGVANWHRADGTWVQPTGATDAYALNAEVTHNGQNWRSTFAGANIWEPGVFGWEVI